MKFKIYTCITILCVSVLHGTLHAFTLEDINSQLEGYSVDFTTDKVDIRISKESQVRLSENGDYIRIKSNDFIDGDDILDLNSVVEIEVEDNSQQGESLDSYSENIIPINYIEKLNSQIEKERERKEVKFKLKQYESSVQSAKQHLQRYYNPDLSSVLLGGVPSTFGFGNVSAGGTSIDTIGLEGDQADTSNCALSCDCGNYYNSFGVCSTVPANGYSTGNSFKCNTGYTKSGGSCIQNSGSSNSSSSLSSSPYTGIQYNGAVIDESDDPFGVTVNNSSSSTSNSILNINNSIYSNLELESLNFSPRYSASKCGSFYGVTKYCALDHMSIYNPPAE